MLKGNLIFIREIFVAVRGRIRIFSFAIGSGINPWKISESGYNRHYYINQGLQYTERQYIWYLIGVLLGAQREPPDQRAQPLLPPLQVQQPAPGVCLKSWSTKASNYYQLDGINSVRFQSDPHFFTLQPYPHIPN